MPLIQWGIFEKIAEILKFLPAVSVQRKERMLDFCQWLAAMELADGVPTGSYQNEYSDSLKQGQLDALLDSPLASAVMSFAELMPESDFGDDQEWSGTPTELLHQLRHHNDGNERRSHEWPDNPISLSKRLAAMAPALEAQGIRVEVGARGKDRKISIVRVIQS